MKHAKQPEAKVIKRYTTIRFKDDSLFSIQDLEKKFGAKLPSIVCTDGKYIEAGFKQTIIENVVNSILNDAGWDIIAVSEDEHSITYHFIKEMEVA